MTREEILAVAKPVLFNTEMVRAILDERKTATRRLVKPQHLRSLNSPYHQMHPEVPDKVVIEKLCMPPYQPGDYLYVRETYGTYSKTYGTTPNLYYKADGDAPENIEWHPSIHMPKEAARIFLLVTDVKVERLQEIDNVGALKEGCDGRCSEPADGALSDCQKHYDFSVEKFMTVWDSTIKPKDRGKYGWTADPWVWVIEFEKAEAEE